ncbi:Arabinose efflux permease family protein [[Clostridium] ultunense Esp]|nr:Arabinose efflux permease family protein [[Clostridium] ultunense Esp]
MEIHQQRDIQGMEERFMEERTMERDGEKLWTKDFITVTLANLFLFFSFQMLIPTLPAYVQEKGGNDLAVGMVIALFTVSALITRPFAGNALDRIGRKGVLYAGLLLFTLSAFGYVWTATVFLILFLRFVHGIGWGMTTTSFGTIVSDLIPAKRRGEGMGYFGLSSTFAMALAPLLGLWIMNERGFSFLFLLSTGLAVTAFLISLPIRETKGKEPVGGVKGLIEPQALFPSLLIMLFALTYGGVVGFITLFGKEVGIANVGGFFLFNALMVMLVRPVSGVLYDKRGAGWVLIPGTISAVMGLLLLSYTHSTGMLYLSAFFYGIGFGTIQPSLQAWTISRVPPGRRGAANGTFFSSFDLGIGLGSVLLGMVAGWFSYGMMYRVSIVFLLLFLVLYAGYGLGKRSQKGKGEKNAQGL